jgi:hypothetical protein
MEAFEFFSKTHILIGCYEGVSPGPSVIQPSLLVVNTSHIPDTEENRCKDLKGFTLVLPPLTEKIHARNMTIFNDPLTSVSTDVPFYQTQDAKNSVLQIQFRSFDQCVLAIRLSAIGPFLDLLEKGKKHNERIDWSSWGATNTQLFLSQFNTTIGIQDCQLHGSRLMDNFRTGIANDLKAGLYVYDFNSTKHALPPSHRSDKQMQVYNPVHSCKSNTEGPFVQHIQASLPCTRRRMSVLHMEDENGLWPMVFCGDDYLGFVSLNLSGPNKRC